MEDTKSSVFIGRMCIHRVAYERYKAVLRVEGYTKLRKLLKSRWYSCGEQDQVISRIHKDIGK